MARVNQARDAQALNFGVQSTTSAKCLQYSGTASASAAGPPPTLTLADNSANANNLAGCIIFANTNATWASGSVLYGTVLSNTAASPTVVTVDTWSKVLDNTAGQTAAATTNYIVFPAQTPFWHMGITESIASVAGTETGTAPGGTEYGSGEGLERSICTTFTHTAGASTGTIGKTFTYTGSTSKTIGRSFLSNSQVTAAASGRGNFAFFVDQLNGATGYVVASNGDTLQITYTITYTTVP